MLLNSSWTRIWLLVVCVFVGSNAVFALLYVARPGAVEHLHGFADAFAFSVETMCTLGYGDMAPITPWARFVVTFEVFFGLMGLSTATGIVFSKLARPEARVQFSRVAVVTQHYGMPTFWFRVGNLRENELVDTSVTLTALLDDVSPEGHSMRRLVDLAITRNTTPLLGLTWSILHPIDETSPLHGLDESRTDHTVAAIAVTLTGHDPTLGQQVAARHVYRLEDIRWGARFVDILTPRDDGVLVVDYSRFHDVVPDSPAVRAHPTAREPRSKQS